MIDRLWTLIGEPVYVPGHHYLLLRVVARKQWILQQFWEREVQELKKQNLSQDEVKTLTWYIFYYKYVMDSLLGFDEEDQSEEPLKRWAVLERWAPHVHAPPVLESFFGNSDEAHVSLLDWNVEVEDLIQADPWDTQRVLGYVVLSHAPERGVAAVLQNVMWWLRGHEHNEKEILIREKADS
ncbi:hypothetical protein H1R20_g14285, partial [Candolleomyces eurysporus]